VKINANFWNDCDGQPKTALKLQGLEENLSGVKIKNKSTKIVFYLI